MRDDQRATESQDGQCGWLGLDGLLESLTGEKRTASAEAGSEARAVMGKNGE